jgi:hypothetical protein
MKKTPVVVVAKLVGHAHVATTTGHYMRAPGTTEEQVEAMRKVPRLSTPSNIAASSSGPPSCGPGSF